MSIEEAVVERLKALPPDKQREVLYFVDFLHDKTQRAPRKRLKSLKGALAHLDVKVTDHDIAEARREMWGNFPRDIKP